MMAGFKEKYSGLTVKIILAFLAIYTIWGTTYLAIRLAIETIPPFFMAGTRFFLAGIVALSFLLLRGVPWPNWKQWRSATIIGLFLLVGGNGFVTWSEQQVPSGIAALVVATVPLWIALFDWLLFRGERPGRRGAIGVMLGFIGIVLLVGPAQINGTSTINLIYMLILLLAPILWSFGSLYSRQATLPDNTFMSVAMEMLTGGVALFILGLVTGERAQLNIQEISLQSLMATLYLIVFGSIIALTAYIWLLKTVQAAKVATYTYVNPVIAVFLGWLVLGEWVTPLMLLAIGIIILAVFLINTQGQKSAPKQVSRIQMWVNKWAARLGRPIRHNRTNVIK